MRLISSGHDFEPEAVYTEVDLALYRAKHAGRNRVVSIEPIDDGR